MDFVIDYVKLCQSLSAWLWDTLKWLDYEMLFAQIMSSCLMLAYDDCMW